MDERLYKAATEGDVASLVKQIEEDPLLLDRGTSSTTARLETPLHIAAMLGHEAFVAELLKRKPGLARELDSTRSSALHLASAGDHVGVVRALLRAEPDMCSACDRDGRNPLQFAAMMGRTRVLKEMLAVRSEAARAATKRGGTILHLCVEYSQLEALELVVGRAELRDLVNGVDRDGNTALHLAVAHKQLEMTELLLSIPGIELEAINSSGMTAADILMQRQTNTTDSEIRHSLQRAGASIRPHAPPPFHPHTKFNKNPNKSDGGVSWLDRKRSALMVVASLIATMAFQFAATPPPTTLKQTAAAAPSPSQASHNPMSAMDYVRRVGDYLKDGERFYTVNTVSFIASLSIILLLMSGLPLNNRLVVWLLMIITWVAISSLALSYTIAVILQTKPSDDSHYIYAMVAITVFVWICLVSLLLIGHTIRLLVRMIKMFVRMIKAIVGSLWVVIVGRPRPRPALLSTV